MDQTGSSLQITPAMPHCGGRAAAGCSTAFEMDSLLEAAIDTAPVGLIVLYNDFTVRLMTHSAARLLGTYTPDAAACMPIFSLFARCRALDPSAIQMLTSLFDAPEREAQGVLLTLQHDGISRTLYADLRDARGTGWLLSLNDVTETRQTHDWLLEHVSSDPVTGLWNRQHFMLMLQDALTLATNDRGLNQPCLVMVSLTSFRQTTEALGIETGDALLRMVVDRLSALLCDTDMLARFSDDEFAVVVGRPCQEDLESYCAVLEQRLAEPYALDGEFRRLSMRIGAAIWPRDGSTPDELVAHASLAVRAVATVSGLRFFDRGLVEQAHSRRAFEADLRLALGLGEFELHYQPQVDVFRCVVTGLEALIRWRSPQRGLVPPIEFINLAEQMGLIGEIGDWVLREACRQAVNWPGEVTVAVNASPLQFETGHFASSVAAALAVSGLPASRLEIEITENLLLQDTGIVLDTLAALQKMGVRLVLDDFGTGFASLSQLARFRFDKIKIDRSFVSSTEISEQNSAIVRSIAALGASLGIPTTAEGVETFTQLEQIKADGCTCVQGYYFSRPVPLAEVDRMLRQLHHPSLFAAA